MNTLLPLSPREKTLLSFIEEFQMEYGTSPTVKEMRMHMHLKSDNCIVYWMKSLKKKGYIEKGDTPRSIKMLPRVRERLQSSTIKLPVLGFVPAGGPVLSEQNVEDWISLHEGAVKKPDDCFVLRVTGDSMIDAGIFQGDYVIVDSKRSPRIGDYVVALEDNGNTVKTYAKDSQGRFYLKPENKNYSPIYPERELEIQGVVVGLMRWYQ